jgi:tetratricopeptide (TPR) repeat protein
MAKKLLVFALAAIALASCSRDPNVAKQRYLENGNKYFERGKFREASIMYRNALSRDALFGPAHYKLAVAELALGRLPQAVASLRRAIERLPATDPDHWGAAVKLADIYVTASRDKQHLDEARDIARRLLEREPESHDGHRLTADLAFVEAQGNLGSGNSQAGQQMLESAIKSYRRADAAKPEQPGVRIALGRALATAGQFAEAEKTYRGVVERDKHQVAAYTELYQLYMTPRRVGLLLQNKPRRAKRR